jgi:HicA toxin of bacterial toxin-antitoxin,
MSKREKLVNRLLSRPTDFEWRELQAVMDLFGFELKTTGGSGRKFVRPEAAFAIHEPHPYKLLKAYQVRAVIAFLRKEGHIE